MGRAIVGRVLVDPPVIWVEREFMALYHLSMNLMLIGACCVVDKTLAAFVSTKPSQGYEKPAKRDWSITKDEKGKAKTLR